MIIKAESSKLKAELQQLIRTQRTSFYVAGATGAAVAYVPIIQLAVPVLTVQALPTLAAAAWPIIKSKFSGVSNPSPS